METIWDHNPTEEELRRLAIRPDDGYYRAKAGQDTHYMLISGLVGLRGGSVDDQQVWVDKIQNPSDRRMCTMALHEISD